MDLGFRLSTVRRARRLTQQEVAAKAGITQKHLSRLETGAASVLSLRGGLVVQLARLLQVSTDYLLGVSDTVEMEQGLSGLEPSSPPPRPRRTAQTDDLVGMDAADSTPKRPKRKRSVA